MNSLREEITTHPFFIGMRPEHLAHLAKNAREATYRAGEVIFREREPASECFLIQSGRVALEAHEPGRTALIETLGENDILGWSWLFPPFEWHFQARAIEDAMVIVLDGAHLLVTAEADRDFGYELMKRMVQILIERLQAARRKLLSNNQKGAAASCARGLS